MILALLAIPATLLIGPYAFHLISDFLYHQHRQQRYPVGVIDGWGDIVFLPLFNAAIVAKGVLDIWNLASLVGAAALALIMTTMFVHWRRDLATKNDWTRPKRGHFNFGGWYHAGFMLVQATIIFYSLHFLYKELLVLLPLVGYLSMVVLRTTQVRLKDY